MEFHEAANFLFDLRRFAPRPGLDPTRGLLAHLGEPQDGLACVQVAGSNGRGSTARLVERALGEAGLSVELYTSPYLDDVRERVRVDSWKISKAAVARATLDAGADLLNDVSGLEDPEMRLVAAVRVARRSGCRGAARRGVRRHWNDSRVGPVGLPTRPLVAGPVPVPRRWRRRFRARVG